MSQDCLKMGNKTSPDTDGITFFVYSRDMDHEATDDGHFGSNGAILVRICTYQSQDHSCEIPEPSRQRDMKLFSSRTSGNFAVLPLITTTVPKCEFGPKNRDFRLTNDCCTVKESR
jgi:hypothetical protein